AAGPKPSAKASSAGIATASPSSKSRAPSDRIVARCALGIRSLSRAESSGVRRAGTSATASMRASDGIDGTAARMTVAAMSTVSDTATTFVRSKRPAVLCASHEATTVLVHPDHDDTKRRQRQPDAERIRLQQHVVDDERYDENRRVQKDECAHNGPPCGDAQRAL